MNTFTKKHTLLLTILILKDYSDENHPLTQQMILDKLMELYGISLDRHALSGSIKFLYDLGADIVESSKGYYLASRYFDKSELIYLVDSIFSSRSIPASNALKLANLFSSTLSIYERQDFGYIQKSVDLVRATNKDLFLNIELINEAIRKKKRISFQYLMFDDNGHPQVRMDGFRYWASPYYLINNFGRYYCILYKYKAPGLSSYRVDMMINIEIEYDRDVKPIADIDPDFNITTYLNDHIYPFSDTVTTAEFEILDKKGITYIKDWFGANAFIFKDNEKIKAYVKCDSKALFYWIMQYGEVIKLLGPNDLLQQVKGHIRYLNQIYDINF